MIAFTLFSLSLLFIYVIGFSKLRLPPDPFASEILILQKSGKH